MKGMRQKMVMQGPPRVHKRDKDPGDFGPDGALGRKLKRKTVRNKQTPR